MYHQFQLAKLSRYYNLEMNNTSLTVMLGEFNNNTYLSCRNLKGVNMYRAQDVTIFELMNSNTLVLDETGVEYFNNLGIN